MEKKKIYFIYMPSPILGRNPIQGVTGSGIFGALFNLYTEDNYILALQKAIAQKNLDWHVYRDDTESDIKKLIEQGARLLVCAPGLKYMFYRKGFDRKNIIYLDTFEYANNVTTPVIDRIAELENLQWIYVYSSLFTHVEVPYTISK
ncbi:nitrogen fixation protein NifS [Providencia stuartii]|nr:nitrogen fixation protein NifS [Providencia stuartii]MDN0005283.1 nitrogen fixation protein NifS [Providencia stuartii]